MQWDLRDLRTQSPAAVGNRPMDDLNTLDFTPYFQSIYGTYDTAQFDAADPRNVAPGANSVDVNGKLPTAWEQAQKALRENKTAVYWAAAGLVALALLKGRR